MRARTRGGKGVALVAAIICICLLVALVGALTVQLAGLTLESSRCAQAVRARALAEAGVETALEKLTTDKGSDVKHIHFALDSGSCSVRVAPDEKQPGRFTIVSEGELKLAGGQMKSCVTLVVHVKDGDTGKSIRILSRKEGTRYVRTKVK